VPLQRVSLKVFGPIWPPRADGVAFGMANTTQMSFTRKVLLALWAMATLVLLFTVVLLTSELIRLGHNPLTLPEVLPEPVASVAPPESSTESQDVTLYFATADARQLIGETRSLSHTKSTVENCRTALDALVEGPLPPLHALIPKSVDVRGMWLLDNGELVVDFTYPLQDARKSVSEEALLVYSVVDTLVQPALQGSDKKLVRSVRFLIGGLPPTHLYPAHLDLSGAIAPDTQWIATPESEQAGDA